MKHFKMFMGFLVFGVFCWASCASPPMPGESDVEAYGGVDIQVSTSALSQVSDISRIIVTVTGATDEDGFPVEFTLTRGTDNYTWTGSSDDIPVGTNRTFTAVAYGVDITDLDSDEDTLFTGTATGVTIAESGVVDVIIYMQQTEPPVAFENNAPRVTSIVISDGHIAQRRSGDPVITTPGTANTAVITVAATDADGNPMTFAWGGGGVFNPATASSSPAETQWSTEDEGLYTLFSRVSDNMGATTWVAFQITVYALGQADVSVDINSAPYVSAMTIDQAYLPQVDNQAHLTAILGDPESTDQLTCTWSVVNPDGVTGCAGTFNAFSHSNPVAPGTTIETTFTLNGLPNSGYDCILRATVCDDSNIDNRGCNTGEIIIHTGPPVNPVYNNLLSK